LIVLILVIAEVGVSDQDIYLDLDFF
jgi:hypothetical protein